MSKATGIPATLLEGDLCFERASGIPGAIWYATYAAVPDSRLLYSCPCGCGAIGFLLVRPFEGKPYWHNSGSQERPTIKPSIGLTRSADDKDTESDGYHWHGYLVDGVWESC